MEGREAKRRKKQARLKREQERRAAELKAKVAAQSEARRRDSNPRPSLRLSPAPCAPRCV